MESSKKPNTPQRKWDIAQKFRMKNTMNTGVEGKPANSAGASRIEYLPCASKDILVILRSRNKAKNGIYYKNLSLYV